MTNFTMAFAKNNIVIYRVNSIITDAVTKPHDDEFYYGIGQNRHSRIVRENTPQRLMRVSYTNGISFFQCGAKGR
jgi:hypothetical protein